MAVYNLPNYQSAQGFGMPYNIRRGNPNPLDNSSVWASLEAAQNYAQNDPVAYVGQILTVVEDVIVDDVTVKTATAYVIDNEAGDLKEVGSSPVGDENTITVSEDGTVSLYGIEGLALTREEEDGSVTKINYQPLLVEGKLTWVEPSATTAEGLAIELEALQTSINNKIGDIGDKTIAQAIEDAQAAATYDDTDVKDSIAALEELVGKDAVETQIDNKIEELKLAETYVSKETYDEYVAANDIAVKANADAIEKLNGDDKTAGSVDYKIAQEVAKILNDNDEDVDTLEEIAAWIKNDTAGVGALNKAVTDNADAIAAIKEGATIDTFKGIEDKIGDLTETTVAAEIEAAKNAAIEEATYNDKEVKDDIADLQSASHTHDNADVLKDITADQVSAWDGAEQAAKDYADDIKDELNQAIGGKVEAETGKSLIADTLISKLEGIAEGAQVNVIDTVDTAQFGLEGKHLTLLEIAQGKVAGLTEALAGKVDKVDGSRLITSDEATKLEKLVLGENGEVSVSGKVAAGNVDGLDAWITARAGTLKGLSENNFTGALLDKLNAIDTEVLANKIESVKVGDSLLDIIDKTVTIPVAGTTLGLVKSYVGDAYNKVVVAEDGTMSVDKIDISTIYVPAGTELVLNGGSSANA